MTIEQKFVRVTDPGSPTRCQGSTPDGQCPYESLPHATFCAMHGGTMQQQVIAKENIRNYRIAKWQARLNEFADSDKVKNLREEIGMLRIMLEEIWNRCNDSNDVLIFSNKIIEITGRLEKLVSSCHRLEQSTGMLLDKTQILNLASQIVEVIGNHVKEPEVVDKIAQELIIMIAQKSTTKVDT